ncbi:putative duf498 domain protein [Golovinomyces cichoracearum]|uniref:Putative duf498 domain protein n=1 Tax=Golovinomyces cichoracearum TaxID=62708 RepID=A0A420II50_9PEZI|nr:putative duf498 domain protein [Golovinomyces cichoracearum]
MLRGIISKQQSVFNKTYPCALRTIQTPPRILFKFPPCIRHISHSTRDSFRDVPKDLKHSLARQSHDRGPLSTEDTQTDFGNLDILGNIPVPSTSIDACLWDGFHLNSGLKVTGGKGVILAAGGAFSWQPWMAREDGVKRLLNENGQWEVENEAWGILEIIWPKPDLLILGLGKKMQPLSHKTRSKINSLGIRVEIQDTRNAAAQYNLLATERGLNNVAAALIPIGWREDVGVQL